MVKQTRIRSKAHLKFIASLPCVVTGGHEVQAAHIRTGCLSMGMKPCDSLTVPLHWMEHARQHTMNEAAFWEPYGGIDRVKQLARDLYAVSGDKDAAIMLITEFRNDFQNSK